MGIRRQIALSVLSVVTAKRDADMVTYLPGFPNASTWGFDAYSGILDVPGPIASYDALKIHYQFHTSQRDAGDPINIWHQGGPGGSSINTGLYGIVGAFRVGDDEHGNYINPSSWNRVANMLYLETPAGAGGSSGYSQCIQGGVLIDCSWNDITQAEAYAATIKAFLAAFPEFASNDIYLSGESYFGQYGPNIAQYIVNNEPSINLKGIAAGNACWGGTETCLSCNGPSTSRIDVIQYFGKGLYSSKLHEQILETCSFPSGNNFSLFPVNKSGTGAAECDADRLIYQGQEVYGEGCGDLLDEMYRQVGPHNIDMVYDNCPDTMAFLRRVGKDARWLQRELLSGMHDPVATHGRLLELNGGYEWDCGGNAYSWIKRDDVREALHLNGEGISPGASRFYYNASGPASHLIWPELARKLRVLIFNGDADACVPLVGNEEWVLALEEQGVLKETAAWAPWFLNGSSTPAGYETAYEAEGGSGLDFTLKTVRLAGHMVSTFRPEEGLQLISDFLAGGVVQEVV